MGGLESDLAWEEAPTNVATISVLKPPDGLRRWSGAVDFSALPEPGEYRVVIREYEYISANYINTSGRGRAARREQPKRLIYAETVLVDSALIAPPGGVTDTTV
jgi:hypothetical protein